MSVGVTFDQPGHELPVVVGRVPGVIGVDPETHIVTVQCAVCHLTATGRVVRAVQAISFRRYTDIDGRRGNPLPYRRCAECRNAERHP